MDQRVITWSLVILMTVCSHARGQKFVVDKSKVTFFSDAVLEDITATNTNTSGILNADNGEFAFSVPIRDFKFQKSLMREHFNEKYMESEKFPRATFTGKIMNFNKDESLANEVTAKGKLTIHGVERDVEIPGTLKKNKNNYTIRARFIVKLEDYNVKIPQLMWQNIAEQVEVNVDFQLKPQ